MTLTFWCPLTGAALDANPGQFVTTTVNDESASAFHAAFQAALDGGELPPAPAGREEGASGIWCSAMRSGTPCWADCDLDPARRLHQPEGALAPAPAAAGS